MPDRLDPQMAQALRRQADLNRAHPLSEKPALDELRAQAIATRVPFNENPPELFAVDDMTVEGPFRRVPVRRYQPTAAAANGPAIFYVHGGGWVSCSLDTHDWAMRRLALDSGLMVIGVDPAQAPEFRFPKPVQEVATVFGRIAAQAAEYRIDGTRLAFAGCSSGANLALGAALNMVQPFFRAGALFYGIYGAGKDTASARAYGDGRYGLSTDDIAWCVKNYFSTRADKLDPRGAPVRGDLGRLPPLYLAAAELDPLRDDTLDLADRLVECGVRCETRVYKGLAHSYLIYAGMVEAARTSIRHAAAHVRRQFFEPMPKLAVEFAEEIRNAG